MPAIYSPLMIQAGFGEQEVKSYVARLDGLTQYWQLSESINLIANDVVELSFVGGSIGNAFAMFYESDAGNFYMSVTSDSLNFRVKAVFGTPILNGQQIVNNTTPVPLSGENTISAAIVSDEDISVIGARVGGSLLMNLPLFGFKVIRGGEIINEIPLTNKAQGATQLPNVGGVSATMINYTEAVWQEL